MRRIRELVLAAVAMTAWVTPRDARASDHFNPDLHWITAASFILHVSEELPQFPAWATRRFGATSTPWFVYSHVPLVAGVVVTSAWARDAAPRSTAVVASMAVQWTLFTNGVFHLASTAVFDEYSPGLVTGTLVYFPATAYLFHRALDSGRISHRQAWAAVGIGTAVSAAVVASLYLEMDLDWTLRRGRSSRASASQPSWSVAPIVMPGARGGLGVFGSF